MGATIDTRIQLKRDTKANWNRAVGFRPLRGEVIIYEDYQTYEIEQYGQTVTRNIPGIKIGDGSTYVQDLPFVDDELRDKLMDHINNLDIHVTLEDKNFWNNKVNIDDSNESTFSESAYLENENLIFNRN